MRKFFTDFSIEGEEDTLFISGQEAKHILKVLRFKIGDKFIISNFSEQSFEAEIIHSDGKTCTVKLLNKVDIVNKSNIDITVFQGYPKGDKLELIVQKLTEIGVNKIVPVLTARVNGKLDGSRFKEERINKIAKEACKQCGISTIPEISAPIKLYDIKEEEIRGNDLILIPYEKESTGLKSTLRNYDGIKKVCVFIGPEGGFEEEEVNYIKSLGGIPVSLGQTILRTETASIFISSIIKYEFGDGEI